MSKAKAYKRASAKITRIRDLSEDLISCCLDNNVSEAKKLIQMGADVNFHEHGFNSGI